MARAIEKTIVVSIGTGIGIGPNAGQQQSPAQFARFEQAVRALLEQHGTIYVDGSRSFGTDEEGQPKGGSTFVAGVVLPDGESVHLRHSIGLLARAHEQHCIAVTVGETFFEG